MPSFELSRRIEAPARVVWDLLTDHAGYATWTPLASSTLERRGMDDDNGVGAVRLLRAWPIAIREEVVASTPITTFSYTIRSGVPVNDYLAVVTLTPDGDRATNVHYRVSFAKKLPLTGRLMKAVFRKTIADLLKSASFEAPRRARP
jgi:uncharacterized protein YndB with AHSA1/START domain